MVDFTRQYFAPSPLPNVKNGVCIRATRQFFAQAQSSATLYRGFDTGLNQYVTWTVNTLTPDPSQTTPNYTGTLIDAHIEVP